MDQLAARSKACPTVVTNVRFISAAAALVGVQVGFLHEACPTVFTDKWPLSCVNALVYGKVVVLHEACPTARVNADTGPLSCVAAHVRDQVALRSKARRATFTAMRSLTGVNALVLG